MAETIDEATIIAWVDGELEETSAARVAQAAVGDPALTEMADRHRRMKARFAAAFGPIADEPVAMQPPAPAPVISLAAARAEREAKVTRPQPRWWGVGSAIAASLMVGVLIGHGTGGSQGVVDRPGALALAAPIASALDGQLSGDDGPVRVALSFKNRDGEYCRSFAGESLSGVACRNTGGWQLRYASPSQKQTGDYRMAGSDAAQAQVVAAMIDGEPLSRAGEDAARRVRWR